MRGFSSGPCRRTNDFDFNFFPFCLPPTITALPSKGDTIRKYLMTAREMFYCYNVPLMPQHRARDVGRLSSIPVSSPWTRLNAKVINSKHLKLHFLILNFQRYRAASWRWRRWPQDYNAVSHCHVKIGTQPLGSPATGIRHKNLHMNARKGINGSFQEHSHMTCDCRHHSSPPRCIRASAAVVACVVEEHLHLPVLRY